MSNNKRCQKCDGPGPFSESFRTKDGFNKDCDKCIYVFVQAGSKTCSKCGNGGPFQRSNSSRDGMSSRCVVCLREDGRKYREENGEKIADGNKKWKAANPKKSAQYAKANYARNIKKARLERQEYYKKNKEQMNTRVRGNYYADRETRLAKISVWKATNPEKVSRSSARRRGWMVNAGGDATIEQIEARIAFFGGMCAYCGAKPWEHLDHAISLAQGGSNWPANLRPSCAECNHSKQAQTWFLITLEARSIPKNIAPRVWMCEREKEVFKQKVGSFISTTLCHLALKFKHQELVSYAGMGDEPDVEEMAELAEENRLASLSDSAYNGWRHIQHTSGAWD
jgi:5-methylcytosine-specific restriction endonuclease McrA